jgi:UDP-glucose 4-epimerase
MQIEGGRFLVIGGAGFIGSHVVDLLLERGVAHVRIFDNFSRGRLENLVSALKDPRVELFEPKGDILHKDTLCKAMEGVDGVFHLAALWLLQCYEFPRSAFDVNINGMMNVVETAIASDIKKLVFSSSASVYGEPLVEPMTESHPFNCVDFYGASKVCGEMILKAMHQRAKSRGETVFDFVGLRYMNVYGPRQYDDGEYIGVVVKMLNALDLGEQPVIHGTGEQAYDFIDVRDCARANIAAMESNVSSEFLNIGTGKKTSIQQLAQMLTEMHPSRLKPKFMPADRPSVSNRLGLIDKARDAIGFVAVTAFEQGLSEYISWRLNDRVQHR